jgi:predicted tellurium resistance membrane protein TerC
MALSFLLLIGVLLFAEGLHTHVPIGFIYFAIFFSLAVEMLNLRMRKNKNPVKLKKRLKE